MPVTATLLGKLGGKPETVEEYINVTHKTRKAKPSGWGRTAAVFHGHIVNGDEYPVICGEYIAKRNGGSETNGGGWYPPPSCSGTCAVPSPGFGWSNTQGGGVK